MVTKPKGPNMPAARQAEAQRPFIGPIQTGAAATGIASSNSAANINNRIKLNVKMPQAPQPSTAAPTLTYWTKKNIQGDQEATIKNLLIDTIGRCEECPSEWSKLTIGQAVQQNSQMLNQDQSQVQTLTQQYGVDQKRTPAEQPIKTTRRRRARNHQHQRTLANTRTNGKNQSQ